MADSLVLLGLGGTIIAVVLIASIIIRRRKDRAPRDESDSMKHNESQSKLDSLLESGEITQREYDRAKETLLDSRHVMEHPPSRLERTNVPSPPSAASAQQVEPLEPVLLGASTPQSLRPGDEFSARFFAYTPSYRVTIEEIIDKLGPFSRSAYGIKSSNWERGTTVKVRFGGKHLEIPEPEREFEWDGAYNLEHFDAEVQQDAPEGVIVLKFDVLIDDIIVGQVRMDVLISREVQSKFPEVVMGVKPSHTAFASYAREDQDIVKHRISSVRISAHLDVFVDYLGLFANDKWEVRLEEEIRARDLFLLFWSSNAKRSKWVDWEWRTALKDDKRIQVHPLENGVRPPDELSDVNFDDPYVR